MLKNTQDQQRRAACWMTSIMFANPTVRSIFHSHYLGRG
jgi:hypothetical protein